MDEVQGKFLHSLSIICIYCESLFVSQLGSLVACLVRVQLGWKHRPMIRERPFQ